MTPGCRYIIRNITAPYIKIIGVFHVHSFLLDIVNGFSHKVFTAPSSEVINLSVWAQSLKNANVKDKNFIYTYMFLSMENRCLNLSWSYMAGPAEWNTSVEVSVDQWLVS